MPTSARKDGGRYRIRTYDFHRVNLGVFGFRTTYRDVKAAQNLVRRTRHRVLWNGLWNGKELGENKANLINGPMTDSDNLNT
jgi:hypothetical protein